MDQNQDQNQKPEQNQNPQQEQKPEVPLTQPSSLPSSPPEYPAEPEDKYHRQISGQEKTDLVLKVLKKEMTVEQVCLEMGITKEGFYKWMRVGVKSMKDSLEPKTRGRKAELPPADKEELSKLQKKNRELEKEKLKLESKYRIASRLIEWQEQEQAVKESKKNIIAKKQRKKSSGT